MKLEESAEDFNRKFEGCYFKITKPTEGLFKHSHIEGNHIIGEAIHKDKKEAISCNIKDFESTFAYPTLGIINIDRNVIYLNRLASRQWRRGFYPYGNTMNIHVPLSHGISSYCVRYDHSPSIITSIFYPEYYTEAVAWKKVLKGHRISAAFTPSFYVGVNSHLPFIYLGYKDYYIGKAEEDKYILEPEAAHLYEELSNVCSKEIIIGDVN